MARTIDHISRISDSFDALDTMSQSDIAYELFTRLNDPAKADALRRINNHAKMARRSSTVEIEMGKVIAEVHEAQS